MGWLKTLAGPAGGHPGKPADTLWLRDAFFGQQSQSGKFVTVDSALALPAVFSAVELLADGVGALPFHTYQRVRGGGRLKAWSEPVYRLLHDEPNPEMSAIDCWSLVTTHLNTWGDAFLGKDMLGSTVAALWPIAPDLVRVAREKGEKVFYVRSEDNFDERRYTSREIIHVMGRSLRGLRGLSPIQQAREAIGLGLALDEYGNRFFSNSAIPRVVLKHPKELSDGAARRLKADWKTKYGGSQKSNETAILEEGLELQVLSMPLEDAQFVESQKFSVQQVARMFRVPASKIGGSAGDSLTYRTVEGDSIDFVTYSLRPWLKRIEQALARDPDLFPVTSMYPEFLVDDLLRADTNTRANVYQKALDPRTGWMARAEVRDTENLPPEANPTP